MAIQWTRRGVLKAGVAGAAVAGAAGVAALALPRSRKAYRASKKNVILIVCDAMRADQVGRQKAFGGTRQSLTPNIDGIAAGGVTFANAKSPSSFTPVSMLSLMYDIPSTQFDFVRASTSRPGTPNIPTALAEKGYVTLFSCANMLLSFHHYTRGFDKTAMLKVSDKSQRKMDRGTGGALWPEISGAEVNSRAFGLLEECAHEFHKQPVYLQVHYMDTHTPYNRTGYPMDVPIDEAICTSNVRDAVRAGKASFTKGGMTTEQALSYLREYYDSATHAVDRSVGELLDTLATYKILDDCLVIVTADHGEEFADGREAMPSYVGHEGPLNEEQIHVPLVVRSTGSAAYYSGGGKVADQASSATVINGIIKDYTSTSRGQYAEVRSAVEAGAFPEHRIVSAVSSARSNTNESALIWRDELGYLKHRVFYDETGGVTAHSAFRYAANESLEQVRVSPEMKEKTLAALGDYKPRAQTLDKETEEKMRALGYLR